MAQDAVAEPGAAPLASGGPGVLSDPFGLAKPYAANCAPIHLLLTAPEREIFADASFGYHRVDVRVQALDATLRVALLLGLLG